MLIPEEETLNTIIEKGTFYTPDIQTEFEEKSPLKKALPWIAGGVVALLLLLLFLL